MKNSLLNAITASKLTLAILFLVAFLPLVSAETSLNPFGGEKSKLDVNSIPDFFKDDYNINYGAIEISNTIMWIKTSKLAEYSLISNTEKCYIECSASGKAVLYENGRLFDGIRFVDLNSKENRNVDYDIYLYKKFDRYIDVPIEFKKTCVYDEKNNSDICENVAIKYEKVNNPYFEWIEYDGGILDAGNYIWKLNGIKNPKNSIDWIASIKGFEVPEWAPWTTADCAGAGGNITIYGEYCVHTFTYNNSFNITKTINVTSLLMIAGGGGGGGTRKGGYGPGGGGAGGLIYNTTNTSLVAGNYGVIIGEGGDGGTGTGVTTETSGVSGTNTTFNGTIAIGGGGGAKGYNGVAGTNGGSGGGGSRSVVNGGTGGVGVVGQGNGGGSGCSGVAPNPGGGGGGSATNGSNTTGVCATQLSWGGNGTLINFNGSSIYWGGGGAGGAGSGASYATGGLGGGGNATVNNGTSGTWFGAGGGAPGNNDATPGWGGNGSNGIVMIAYLAESIFFPAKLNITLNTPINSTNTTATSIIFNATLNPEYLNLTNATLIIYNEDKSVLVKVYNTTLYNATVQTNVSLAYNTFTDGNYLWTYQACGINNSNTPFDHVCFMNNTNFSITIDTTKPSTNISQPLNQSYTTNRTAMNFSVSDTNLASCWFGNGTTNQTTSCTANITGNTSNQGSNRWTIYANDTAGNLNFTSVTFFVDSIYPIVTLLNPINDTNVSTTASRDYSCNATDANVIAVAFYIWNDTGIYADETNTSGISGIYNFTSGLGADGKYNWNCIVTDIVGNQNRSLYNHTITLDTSAPNVDIIFPINTSYTSLVTSLNFSATDLHLGSCIFWNGTNNQTADCANNITNTSNQGSNFWQLFVNDSSGNFNQSNVTFYVDSIIPSINVTYPYSRNYSSHLIALNYTFAESNPSSCWYSLNYGVTNTTISCGTNITGITSSLGNNNWTVWINDTLNNINYSTARFNVNFTKVTLVYPVDNYLNFTNQLNSYYTCSAIANKPITVINTSFWHNITGTWARNQTISINDGTESIGIVYNLASNGNYGMNFTALQNSKLIKVGFYAGSVITSCNLTNGAGTAILASGTVDGLNCNFDYDVIAGTSYEINFTGNWKYNGTVTYPVAGTNGIIRWNSGIESGGGTDTTTAYGVTNMTFNKASNTTFNLSRVVSASWFCSSCDSENNCFYSNENRTNYYAYENSQTYTATTTEGNTNAFTINITYDTAKYPNLIANLSYNNTMYSGTISTVGSDRIISASTVAPLIVSSTNISFYWIIGFINSSGTATYRNSTWGNQTVSNLTIADCSSLTYSILNLSVKDERTQNLIDASVYNTTIEVELYLYPTSSGSYIVNYSQNFSNTNNASICMENSIGNSTYRLYGEIRYYGDEYRTRHYYFQNYTMVNSSMPQLINLFDIKTLQSTQFLITYKDSSFLPTANAIIDIDRKYVPESLFKTVEMVKTDDSGQGTAYFDLNGVTYSINVYKEGQLLSVFNNTALFCENSATGQCNLNLYADVGSINAENFQTYHNLAYSVSFDRATRAVSVPFTVLDGSSSNIFLNVTKFDGYNNVTLCSNSLTSTSGTLTCSIPASYGNLTFATEVYMDAILITTMLNSIQPTANEIYSGSLVVLLLVLLLTLPMMFMPSNVGVIIGASIAVIIMFPLFYIGGAIIGIGGLGAWAIIAGGIIIWKINHRGQD